jgi:hypothetical protein
LIHVETSTSPLDQLSWEDQLVLEEALKAIARDRGEDVEGLAQH